MREEDQLVVDVIMEAKGRGDVRKGQGMQATSRS